MTTSPTPATPADRAWRVVVATEHQHQHAEIRRLLRPHEPERSCAFVAAECFEATLHAVLDTPEGVPDCLILDDRLPGAHTTDVLARLADPDGHCVCPVLVLTGDGDWAASREVLRAGAQGLLGKGWMTSESLTQAVEQAVERFRMTQELRQQATVARQGVSIDVTDRGAAAQAGRSSEERLQLAILAGRAGTWDLDLDTGRNIWSDSHFTLFGYEPTPNRESTPEMFLDVVLPEDLPRVLEACEQAAREHALFSSEYRIRRANDGELIWVRATGRYFCNHVGEPVRFVGVFYDVTDHKRAEQALEDANRHKDEFLATLAHELRNPLAPIRHAHELLRQGEVVGEAAAKVHDTMARQLGHLVRLVDDLLDVSRISHGLVALHRERVTVASIVPHAVEQSRPLIEARGHTLSIRTLDEPAWVNGDLTRLAQVVGNLLDNAAKFTPNGGRIELSTGVEGAEVIIRVTDGGIGIEPDMLPRVFDLFARVDRRLQRKQGGLGIGLALARSVVELHGGTLVAESPGLDRGSTFTVRLPFVAEVAGRPSPVNEALPPVSGRRVLVVDDNVDAAEMLAMLLQLSGHETMVAHSGPEALEAVRVWQPELVFLDVGMPKMSGHEVARRLRADPSTASVMLVAVTGWGSEDDRRASKEAGFDLHLVKPVGRTELTEVLALLRPSAPGRPAASGGSIARRESPGRVD